MGWWRDEYPRTARKEVKGGIKARSRRGPFGENWWARRWVEAMELFHSDSRLARGRTYARSGQVISIDIDKGDVTSKVQGSRPEPYEVSIAVDTLSPEDWEKVVGELTHDPYLAAKLLAGDLPEEVEGVFAKAGVSLLPTRIVELHTECSCPDWRDPCKHIAAVYYLLAEEFDRDPFLVFRLRGIAREEFHGALTDAGAGADVVPTYSPEPLTQSPAQYWGEGAPLDSHADAARVPALTASLAKQAGHFPFWRAEEPFMEALEQAYRCASAAGRRIIAGEPLSDRSEGAGEDQ
jgi:uncharacterized Zn finger protein